MGVIILSYILKILISILFILIFSILLEDYNWIFALPVHFQLWFFIFNTLVLIFLVFTKAKRIYFIFATISFLFYLIRVLPFLIPPTNDLIPTQDNSNNRANIFYGNINSQNAEKDKLIKYLKNRSPDFVFLVEVTTAWVMELKSLENIYPYSKMIVRENNFGLAVLSKYPLSVENFYFDRENLIPSLFLKTETPLGPLKLGILHAFPPLGKYGTILRDQYLKTLSFKISELNSPIIICGDFNATPWSSIFKEFLTNSKLNTNKLRRFPNTWPTIPLIPSIPIDHCLTKGLNFDSYERGPQIESDHWPLEMRVSKLININSN